MSETPQGSTPQVPPPSPYTGRAAAAPAPPPPGPYVPEAAGYPAGAGGAGPQGYQPYPGTSAERRGNPLLGWLFLLPALLLGLWQLVIPAVRTLLLSFQSISFVPLGGTDGEFVGMDNYGFALSELGAGAWFTALAIGLLPAVVGLVAGVVVGLAHARSGAGNVRTGLVLLGLCLAFVAPLSAVLAYLGPGGVLVSSGVLRPIGSTSALVASLVAWFMLPAVLAAVVTSAAGRRGVMARGALAVLGAVTLLGGVAWGLQSFTIPYITATPAPMEFAYRSGFVYGDMGVGAATATLIGLVAGACGLVAVAVLVASRLRLELDPAPVAPAPTPPAPAEGVPAGGAVPYGAPAGPASAGPASAGPTSAGPTSAAGTVLAAILLGVAVVLALPWLLSLGNPAGEVAASQSATWLPPLVGGVAAVVVAAAAGIGIGYHRALGRASEWLLLLFAPWLFVGVGPTMGVMYLTARDAGTVGTFWSLVPTLVVVPLVVLATYAAAAVGRAGAGAARAALRPVGALALAALTLVVWLESQSLLQALLMAIPPHPMPAAVAVLQAVATAQPGMPLGVLTPLPVLVIVAALFAVSFAGLTRWRVVRDG